MSVRKGSKIIAGAYAVIKPDVYVKTEVDDLLDKKQDKLIAGTNIFIGDDNVISATGGSGGYIDVVQETGDSTDDVMSQASVTHELEQKVNTLDLADIAFTSDYNDLINAPDLATYTKTEDLAEVALTGDYDDLGNTPDLTLYAKTEDLSKVAVSNNYEDLDNKPNLNVYDTVVSVNNKLSFKQDNLKAGYGISIEDNTISNTVDTVEWGKIIGDISTQEDLQGEFTAIRDNSLNKTQVTNCLLEVPQRVKLQLNNGILTLKAGSQVIVPNGFEEDGVTPKFDYVDIESDLILTRTWGTAEPVCIFFNLDDMGIAMGGVARFTSGTTAPTATNAQWWYDTSTNLIKRYSSASDTGSRISFPIAICNKTESVENSVIASIDQIFNGMGYIGSTVWVDKGVKGLIPNGRNEDGTLRNYEFEVDELTAFTATYAGSGQYILRFYIDKDGILKDRLVCGKNLHWINKAYIFNGKPTSFDNGHSAVWVKEDTNEIFKTNDGGVTYYKFNAYDCCDVAIGTTQITSFNPKQPFRAVDQQDVNNTIINSVNTIINSSLTECIAVVQTYQNGSSWYRVYSDGWCEQGGRAVINSASVASGTYNAGSVSLIKPLSKVVSWRCQARHDRFNAGVNGDVGGSASSINLYQVNDSTSSFANPFVLWRVEGYIR